MSEVVNRRVIKVLRAEMFPTLPQTVRSLFSQINDPIWGTGPNVIVGPIAEVGAGIAFPCIAVHSEAVPEALTRRKYAHVTLNIDFWLQSANVEGRRILGVLSEYTDRTLQDKNWSGEGLSVQRCYMLSKSRVLFEPQEKLYHLTSTYRIEAISSSFWY